MNANRPGTKAIKPSGQKINFKQKQSLFLILYRTCGKSSDHDPIVLGKNVYKRERGRDLALNFTGLMVETLEIEVSLTLICIEIKLYNMLTLSPRVLKLWCYDAMA